MFLLQIICAIFMIRILHPLCILRGEIKTFYLFIYYYFTINTVLYLTITFSWVFIYWKCPVEDAG